jgi:S1-C subfamily serine protease
VKALTSAAVMSPAVRRAALALALLFAAPAPSPGQGETLREAYQRASTSVVVIRARGEEVGASGPVEFTEIGSGVLISPDGKVATAAHVVQTLENITVEFLGEEPVRARVIASEQWADISILQVSVVPRDATVSKLADSDSFFPGDPVFIVGAPYGLSYSVSDGIISARWAPDTVTKDFPLAEFFQTTATINTGNSGGPMFSRAGELIGIVSHNISKSGGSEGLGFVVTSNTVRSLLVERNRGFFGFDAMLVSGAIAQALNVPQGGGFLVKKVVKDTVASQIGLRGGDRIAIVEGQKIVVGGDILLAVQRIPMTSGADRAKVFKGLESLRVGDDLRFTVLRDDKMVELTMKWTGFPTQFVPVK